MNKDTKIDFTVSDLIQFLDLNYNIDEDIVKLKKKIESYLKIKKSNV